MGTNLNNAGVIRIIIEMPAIFTGPSGSHLIVEGQLTKADGSAYTDGDAVSLPNNGIKVIFHDVISSIWTRGRVLVLRWSSYTMLGLLKHPKDFNKS